MKQQYNNEIKSLENEKQIRINRRNKLEEQVRNLKGFIDYIKEKLEFNEPDEKICGEVIERITIFYGRQFEIRLKNVPLTFRLSYTATGRGKNYKPEFKIISGI